MPAEEWNVARVAIGDVSYPYYFGRHCADRIVASLLAYAADKYLLVTDDTVLSLHGDALLSGLRARREVVVLSRPAGEAMKSPAILSHHLERAIAAGATRRSMVIAFGGGVPGNLGGLVAALLFRGIRLVHVPTTTVAAMDSVLSLKQAINSGHGKNHFGTYYTPTAVYVDVELLKTLPPRQLRSGLCEAAKNCVAIRPTSLADFRRLLTRGDPASTEALFWLLEDSLASKSAVMARDPREQQRGLILEYGHTVGHAVELCDHRLRGAAGLSHGESVALGMLAAARVSSAMGALNDEALRVHAELTAELGVAATVPAGITVSDLVDVVRADNKRGYLDLRGDQTAMVLLRDLGVPAGSRDLPLVTLPLDLVRDVVADLVETPAPRST